MHRIKMIASAALLALAPLAGQAQSAIVVDYLRAASGGDAVATNTLGDDVLAATPVAADLSQAEYFDLALDIGNARESADDAAGAERAYRRALAVGEEAFGKDSQRLRAPLQGIARIEAARGDPLAAEKTLLKSKTIADAELGSEHPSTRDELALLATLKLPVKPAPNGEDRRGDYESSLLRIDERARQAGDIVAQGAGDGAWLPRAAGTDNLQTSPLLVGSVIDEKLGSEVSTWTSQSALGQDASIQPRSITRSKTSNITSRSDERSPFSLVQLKPGDAQAVRLIDESRTLASKARFKDAEARARLAYEIFARNYGPDHPNTAAAIGQIASVLRHTERYNDAIPLLLRALKIYESSLGEDDPNTQAIVYNLAGVYLYQGRTEESLALFRRVLASSLRASGFYSRGTFAAHLGLGQAYFQIGRYSEAEPNFRKALEIVVKIADDANQHMIAIPLGDLGSTLIQLGRLDEAEQILRQALAIREKALGPRDTDTAGSYANVGFVLLEQGQYAEAIPYYERAVAIFSGAFGDRNLSTAVSRESLARALVTVGRYHDAADALAKATISFPGKLVIYEDSRRTLSRQYADIANKILETASELVGKGGADSAVAANAALVDGLLYLIQSLRSSGVGDTVSDSLARGLAGNAGVQAEFGEYRAVLEELSQTRRYRDKAVISDFSAGRSANLADFDRTLKSLETRAQALVETLANRNPLITEVLAPEPLPLSKIERGLLKKNEALLSITTVGSKEKLLVVAVGPGGTRVHAPSMSTGDLDVAVRALRGSLELPSGSTAGAAALSAFDLKLAKRLYDDLIRPLEGAIGKADHLITIAEGPLQSLPLGILVRTVDNADGADLLASYRNAEWLIDRYAVSAAPTISSVAALRRAGAAGAANPFLGIGDPDLSGARRAKPASGDRLILLGGTASAKSVKTLPPVPQTKQLLEDLAGSLGADLQADVYVGSRGSEAELRTLNAKGQLANRRMIAFATHALIAGEFGLDEPALVLTPPVNISNVRADDDGLLRASEVVDLNLNADWVLLTACNTAAADGTLGAEPLSGLAKSFFYAGARSLLVSHWQADANSSAVLIPAMARYAERDGFSEGLAKAQREMRQNAAFDPDPQNNTIHYAHPAIWGAFTLIGDPGR